MNYAPCSLSSGRRRSKSLAEVLTAPSSRLSASLCLEIHISDASVHGIRLFAPPPSQFPRERFSRKQLRRLSFQLRPRVERRFRSEKGSSFSSEIATHAESVVDPELFWKWIILFQWPKVGPTPWITSKRCASTAIAVSVPVLSELGALA